MNRKAKKLKRQLGDYKVVAIVDIVCAIVDWVGVAYIWGMLDVSGRDLPWDIIILSLVAVILLGVLVLLNGIMTLLFTGKAAEVLKDIVPDEDDE